MRQAFLLQSHAITDSLEQHFRLLSHETRGLGPCTLLFHESELESQRRPDPEHSYLVTDRSLKQLGYPMIGETLIPGHPHFCLLLYSQDHPEFDYYWVLEYDVRYSGSWRCFFKHFDGHDADLLTSHIYPYETMPDWPWWELSHPHQSIAPVQRIRSFNPVYRISRKALRLVHESHQLGWRGHFEVLFPTLLSRAGLKIEDFGGDGPFVPAIRKNRFYLGSSPRIDGALEEGTFRFRPPFQEIGGEPNKLYHPVKEAGSALWELKDHHEQAF